MFSKGKVWFMLLLVSTMFVFTACQGSQGGEPKTEGKPTTITLSIDQGLAEVTQTVVDKYNESQDEYHVELIVLPQDSSVVHDDFVNKLTSKDTSVDIMNLDVVYMAEFASAGWLLDLTEHFNEEALDEFIPGTIDAVKYKGELAGIPYLTNASVFFYRKDVLDEINADVPTTWQGWMDLADEAIGVNDVEYLTVFQAKQNESLVCNWVEFIWSNGGNVLDNDSVPVANSENNVEATKLMKDLVTNYAPEGITTYAEPESEQVFLEGKALTLRSWSGTWETLNGEGSKVAGKVGVAALPIGMSGDKGHACLGGSILVVNKFVDADHQAGAVDFIKFITSYDIQKEITIKSAQPPTVAAVYSDSDIIEEIPFYLEFGDVIKDALSRPKSANYSKTSDAIQRNIHQALTGESDVEVALENLQKEIDESLK